VCGRADPYGSDRALLQFLLGTNPVITVEAIAAAPLQVDLLGARGDVHA
jgi:hypothetical protein